MVSAHTEENFYYKIMEPKHFTAQRITKLEEAFTYRKKPDHIQLHVLAIECNLSYNEIAEWFKARRRLWLDELAMDEIKRKAMAKHTNTKSLLTVTPITDK